MLTTGWERQGQHDPPWLPEDIKGRLLIRRNSQFDTGDLTSEEVEFLAGIEYRALRFLSYFVFVVSVRINFY